jgi:hypothetical protein
MIGRNRVRMARTGQYTRGGRFELPRITTCPIYHNLSSLTRQVQTLEECGESKSEDAIAAISSDHTELNHRDILNPGRKPTQAAQERMAHSVPIMWRTG